MLIKYINSIATDTHWLSTVATAAPATPISNPNINIGSSIIFITALIATTLALTFILPSDLTIFAIVGINIGKLAPIAIGLAYSSAYGIMLSVAPNNFNNGSKNIKINIVKTPPNIIADIIAVEATLSASSLSLAPNNLAIYEDDPTPIIWPIALININNGKTTDTAPIANVSFKKPTNAVSTILYAALIKLAIIPGIANFHITFPISSDSIILTLSTFEFKFNHSQFLILYYHLIKIGSLSLIYIFYYWL
ncbi:hypothetical protein SDC9_97580 [bioreactor metagenome]|uniref:Uncharacterized protein n=1 Tax=bioreactor metagenome TaxID=1076179 RepID=A0A645AD02_9ZZZZ